MRCNCCLALSLLSLAIDKRTPEYPNPLPCSPSSCRAFDFEHLISIQETFDEVPGILDVIELTKWLGWEIVSEVTAVIGSRKFKYKGHCKVASKSAFSSFSYLTDDYHHAYSSLSSCLLPIDPSHYCSICQSFNSCNFRSAWSPNRHQHGHLNPDGRPWCVSRHGNHRLWSWGRHRHYSRWQCCRQPSSGRCPHCV
jgi:hypothetical protein